MKYLQILKFPCKNVILFTWLQRKYRVLSLKILQKLRCLVAFQKRPSTPIGLEENFEFLEGQFDLSRKPFLIHYNKTKHSFELSLRICVIQQCIFYLEMRNTGLVNHRTRSLTFVSMLRTFLLDLLLSDSCQKRISADQYHMTASRAQVHTYIHTYFIDFPHRGFSKTIT